MVVFWRELSEFWNMESRETCVELTREVNSNVYEICRHSTTQCNSTLSPDASGCCKSQTVYFLLSNLRTSGFIAALTCSHQGLCHITTQKIWTNSIVISHAVEEMSMFGRPSCRALVPRLWRKNFSRDRCCCHGSKQGGQQSTKIAILDRIGLNNQFNHMVSYRSN